MSTSETRYNETAPIEEIRTLYRELKAKVESGEELRPDDVRKWNVVRSIIEREYKAPGDGE